MRALVFDRFGDPDVLHPAERPDPVLAPGHALVRTAAIGLNFADVYRRRGNYHLAGQPPWILGYEAAGTVVRVCPSVDPDSATPPALTVGTRVGFADAPYANAELVAVPLEKLIALPDDISFETAAASLLQGLTADYLVHDSHVLAAGELCVIHAAGGGVGQLLTAMARAKGARVVALASSEAKREAAVAAGADHAIAYDGWVEAVQALGGADVVYDSVGSTLAASLAATSTRGTVVFYGMAGGDPAPVDPRVLMDRSLTLTGGDLWNELSSADERRARASRLFAAIRSGAVGVNVARRFALADGADAHRYLESRAAIGKVLLVPLRAA